jgi:23S rRNA (guanosine2251-2'-O)-methyltransferase
VTRPAVPSWSGRDDRSAGAGPVIIYGKNAVREALRGKRRVQRVFATRRAAHEVWLGEVEARIVEAHEIQARSGSPDHQGICAEVEAYPYADADSLLDSEEALVLCLDEVQDPHNVGAVCRVAEVAGCAGVVLPERRTAEVTPAVCRASAGAVEHLPVARVRNLADWLAQAKERDAWIYGAAADAEVQYHRPDYRGRVVLVLGSEGRGLRPRVAAACDELVRLPGRGRVSSLNVSTAAAALVYGILHFRAALDRAP